MNEMLSQIEDDIARGRSVDITVGTGASTHAILVVGIDKKSKPPRYEVVSWGQRGWISQRDLKSCLLTLRAADDWGFDDKEVKDGTQKETIPAA